MADELPKPQALALTIMAAAAAVILSIVVFGMNSANPIKWLVGLTAIPGIPYAYVKVTMRSLGVRPGDMSGAGRMWFAHLLLIVFSLLLIAYLDDLPALQTLWNLGEGPGLGRLLTRAELVGVLELLCCFAAVFNGLALGQWRIVHWFFTGESEDDAFNRTARYGGKMFMLTMVLFEEFLK
ncbi:MAG: hypothetical protein QF415_10935 [Candidatus Undinarchaeales archaeon]|nr:hypothetical protein [Candidatus Undinarchaeales archaeon]MDP7494327.1 hypothetical protein [Candidatus Undinarchaeales archaeon]